MSRCAIIGVLVVGFVALGVRPGDASSITCNDTSATLPAPCTDSQLLFDRLDDLEPGPSMVANSHGEVVSTDFNHNSILVGPYGIWASSTWIDTFDVMGGTGTGTINFAWSVDGTLKVFGGIRPCDTPYHGGTGATFGLSALTETSTSTLATDTLFATDALCTPVSLSVAQSGIFSLNFTYGVPFDFGLQLSGSQDSGLVDFSHTGRLTAIILPPGATLTTGSGTTYPTATPVPEPATLTLTALGLASVITRYRSRSLAGRK